MGYEVERLNPTFELSEEQIIQTSSDSHQRNPPLGYNEELAIEIQYNQTRPDVNSDGVNVIYVLQINDDQYLLDYYGFYNGFLVVSSEGVMEFGENLLGNQDRIPTWVVKDRLEDCPDWVPDDYVNNSWVKCYHCDERTSVRDIVTPDGKRDEEPWICQDCYHRKGRVT